VGEQSRLSTWPDVNVLSAFAKLRTATISVLSVHVTTRLPRDGFP
jgi:hypothetical protein